MKTIRLRDRQIEPQLSSKAGNESLVDCLTVPPALTIPKRGFRFGLTKALFLLLTESPSSISLVVADII